MQQFSTTIMRVLKSVRRCGNCHKTLKNKKKYMAYPREYRKWTKDGKVDTWFGIAKRCKRCGYITEADSGG